MRSGTLALWQKRLFGDLPTALVTILLAVLMVSALVPILRWGILNATWNGTTRADCVAGGACWVFIKARFGQFMYGLYPSG